MTIQVSWDSFKGRNPYQGIQVFYVLNDSNLVILVTIQCVQNAGTIFEILPANRPTQAEFLAEYPGAWRVENISSFPAQPFLVNINDHPSTATVTMVPRTNSSVTLLEANPQRRGAIVVNSTGVTMFVKLGAGASQTEYAKRLDAGTAVEQWEIPFSYTGLVSGVWASNGAGNAIVTELTF